MGKCVFDPRSDFSFLLTVKDNEGNEVPLSELDFEGQVYTTSLTGYRFSARFSSEERKQFHCQLRGDQVLIICDNHGLCSGNVKVLLKIHYPDELYPDGIRTEVKRFDTGITLSANANAETPEATPDVSVTVPTVVGKAKKKAFHLSEYCAEGMIPSNAQPGVIYHCEFIKFDTLGIKWEDDTLKNAQREGRVNLTKLFQNYPFDPQNLSCEYPSQWEYSIESADNGNQILKYKLKSFDQEVVSFRGVYPLIYLLRYDTRYWYIDAAGHLQEAQSQVVRKPLPFYLPEDLSEWKRDLKGLYELQRRKRIKTIKTKFDSQEKIIRKYNKWVYIKTKDEYSTQRVFRINEIRENLKAKRRGVFRIRRISKNHHTRSPWVYFTLWENKAGYIKIKGL